jgi:Frag1/DRAM/Sfk1 family
VASGLVCFALCVYLGHGTRLPASQNQPNPNLTISIGTILGLLIPWLLQGRPTLPSFDDGQTIAFISDLGAFNLKPLFIAGSFLTIILYLATLVADRALRHRRIPSHSSCGEMTLSVIAFVGAVLGGAGLVLLSIFDNFRFTATHDKLVGLFIAGNLISAVALVLEYLLVVRRRSLPATDQAMAKKSFLMKLIYLVLEIVATIAFVAAQTVEKNINLAAVLEYVNALLFAWFIFSFIMDLRSPSRGYQAMPKESGIGYGEQAPLEPQWNGRRYEQMRV